MTYTGLTIISIVVAVAAITVAMILELLLYSSQATFVGVFSCVVCLFGIYCAFRSHSEDKKDIFTQAEKVKEDDDDLDSKAICF